MCDTASPGLGRYSVRDPVAQNRQQDARFKIEVLCFQFSGLITVIAYNLNIIAQM